MLVGRTLRSLKSSLPKSRPRFQCLRPGFFDVEQGLVLIQFLLYRWRKAGGGCYQDSPGFLSLALEISRARMALPRSIDGIHRAADRPREPMKSHT